MASSNALLGASSGILAHLTFVGSVARRRGPRRSGYNGHARAALSPEEETRMALHVRRVITGHDANGKAIVHIDEVAGHMASGRPGATAVNVWTTEGFPANNDG